MPSLPPERASKVNLLLLLDPVTEDEVLSALRTRKRRMAPDFLCGTNSIMLKFLAFHRVFLSRLTHFVQLCFRDGFPDSASLAGTILIPKKSDKNPTSLADTRPIAINPAIAKLAKTVLARRLLAAVDGALSDRQYGFRKKR